MFSVGIIGASGYAGAELLRLVAAHPQLKLAWATGDTQAGSPIAELYPSLIGAYGEECFRAYDPNNVDGLDVVMLALPHGKSQELVPDLRGRARTVVDVAADFRLKDASLYPTWYGEAHACPELLAEAVYGLPELHRDALRSATLIAVPGCYPTAATLALAPLVRAGVIENTGLIVDAGCGVSGAGRTLKHGNLYGTVAETYEAYGLLTHRHTPEMEQNIGGQILFTPHLLPMTPRNSGDLLRPSDSNDDIDSEGVARSSGVLCERTIREGHRGIAHHESDRGDEPLSGHGTIRRANEHRRRDIGDR